MMNHTASINQCRKTPIKISRKNGFTLAEITVAVIIVGVLAGLALPRFTGTIERMRSAEGVQILTALLGAQKAHQFESGSYATVLGNLDIEVNTIAYFNVPTVDNATAPNPIAMIRRTGHYTLCIDEDGDLTCENTGGTFTCAQAGITVAGTCP